MTVVASHPATGLPLALSRAAIGTLTEVDLSRCDSAELLDAWREVETLRNRLAALDQKFVVEAESRGLHAEFGARNVAALVRGVLRVEPREAGARVRAADAAVGRVALSGELCPAPFAEVGAAQASGEISPRHAAVIVRAVDQLPDELQASHGARVEHDLVEAARTFDPYELGKLARRMTTLLDQDGALEDVEYRARRRGLTICQRPDGSASISGEATAELAERLLSVLDALAAPKPAVDGTKDPRTAEQRRHDGLLDVLDLVMRAQQLPTVGGISTTVLLTMPATTWTSGDGVATTAHGAVLPAREAIRIAGSEARVMTVQLDENGAVASTTDARRLFTENQRLAMIARDGGCTFPGCDVPPAWTQAHHVLPWTDGGPTEISNGTLLCGHHHRSFEKQGWSCHMTEGRPEWIPPPWVDPNRQPRRNPQPS